jgi:hypothetical protein
MPPRLALGARSRALSFAFAAPASWRVGSKLAAALALCVAAQLSSASARAEAPQAARFGDSIGLGVKFSQGQPMSQLSMLLDLGVSWVRDSVNWEDIEPSPGGYLPFPEDLRKRLEFYRSHDIGVVFILAYDNARAYPPTIDNPFAPIDPIAFGKYAAELGRRLKAAGVRFALEVWNEPHNYVLKEMLGGEWNGKAPSRWVDHYVRMAREAVRAVKAVDPKITVLSDDDMWVIHYWFLEAGLPKELDGFAFHPYTKGPPEITAIGSDTEWVKPFTAVDEDGSFTSAVRRLKRRGQDKLGKPPQLWATEWGWKLGDETPDGPVTEDMVATFLPRAYLVAQAAGVKVLCWFSAQDSVDGPWGLLTNSGGKRKSYVAFRTMAKQLREYQFVRQALGARQPTAGVQAMLFRGAHDHKLAIWSMDAKPRRLSLDGPLKRARAVDHLGRPIKAVRGAAGASQVTLGGAPVYIAITNLGDEATIEAQLESVLAPAK